MPNQNDRHLTTEELSALLDEQLSDQERTAFEAHLATCEQCRGMLNDMRQMAALLHALPAPELPRSFALPLDTKFTPADEPVLADAPIQLATRRNQKRSRLPLVLRTLSTVAAVVGLVFLLSGVFQSIHVGGGTADSGSASSTARGPQAANEHASAVPKTVKPRTSTETVTPQIIKTPPVQATPVPYSQPQISPPPALDPTSPGGQIGIGAFFLVLAVVCLLALVVQNRRSRAP